MATETQKTTYDWHPIANPPKFKKSANGMISYSDLLLVTTTQGKSAIPGFAMRYEREVKAHHINAEKGAIIFCDTKGNVIEHADRYFNCNDVKVPKQIIEQKSEPAEQKPEPAENKS